MATVHDASPTIHTAGPLNEVRLERDGRILWRRLASSTTPITGPIPWPLEPLQPGETIDLRLRPIGAAGADFATISLRAADVRALAANQEQQRRLGTSESAWLQAIDAELRAGRSERGWELLFSPQAPEGGELAELRRERIRLGCGD